MKPRRGNVSEATFSCKTGQKQKTGNQRLHAGFRPQSVFFPPPPPHLLSPVGVENLVFQEEPQLLPAPLALLAALQTAADGSFL